MNFLVIVLFTAHAVQSLEEIDNEIEMQEAKTFKVYWNVPTHMCASKKVYFDDLYENFGIIQNTNHRSSYEGDKITILYSDSANESTAVGLFPAIFRTQNVYRNGGLPQNGNVTLHLEKFGKDLNAKIPDKNFNGVGIIDFEAWRPSFDQLYGTQDIYKTESINIEKRLHDDSYYWDDDMIKDEAKRHFEETARYFMETTLAVASHLRPKARWGYYGFPYCFNMNKYKKEDCSMGLKKENDELSWLWSSSLVLAPSVYSSNLTTYELGSLIRGRIREAARVAENSIEQREILPYFWYRYTNIEQGYLSKENLAMALYTFFNSDASGIIIWGSSSDVNTKKKCNDLLAYVQSTLGPAILDYTKPETKRYVEKEEKLELIHPLSFLPLEFFNRI